jgi:hypothetical protein
MQPNVRQRVYLALERPGLDPKLRRSLVPMPDPVRFTAWIEGKGKFLIVVPAETVAEFIELDRPPLWCDFDAIWSDIARAAERHARDGRFDPRSDPQTGLPRIVLLGEHLAYRSGSARI